LTCTRGLPTLLRGAPLLTLRAGGVRSVWYSEGVYAHWGEITDGATTPTPWVKAERHDQTAKTDAEREDDKSAAEGTARLLHGHMRVGARLGL